MIILFVCFGMTGGNDYPPEVNLPVEELKAEALDTITYTLNDYAGIEFMCHQKIRRAPDPHRFTSIRHTFLASITSKGHKAVIYWMRIRSYTWTIIIEPLLIEIIIVLILICRM